MPDTAKDWFASATQQPSSWWSDWRKWVEPFLGKEVPARAPGKGRLKVIEAAPGSYARVRAEA
jgi:polyhydroxyalkanoate synthase